MKKSIYSLFAMLISLGLMAFIYVNRVDAKKNQGAEIDRLAGGIFANFVKPELEFSYSVDSRYGATITKEDLHNAITVVDIVPVEAEWDKITFLTMQITVIDEGGETTAQGDNEILNAEQTSLLQSTDYSTHFYINARGKHKGDGPEGLKDYPHDEYDLAYYLTVVPEKEAEYSEGMDALIDYLKQQSKEQIASVKEDQLRPGKIGFNINREGHIHRIKLLSSSGYPSIDEHMKSLIRNMPGKWNSAENGKGEKVEQEFVFSYGLIGC